jgi:hypothetical protein
MQVEGNTGNNAKEDIPKKGSKRAHKTKEVKVEHTTTFRKEESKHDTQKSCFYCGADEECNENLFKCAKKMKCVPRTRTQMP